MEVSSLVAALKDLKERTLRLDFLRVLVPHLSKTLTSSDCILIVGQFDRDTCLEALRVLAPHLDGHLDVCDVMEILEKFDHEYRLDVLRAVFSNRSIVLTASDFLLISKELEEQDRIDGFYVMFSFLQGPFSMTDVIDILTNFENDIQVLMVIRELFNRGLFKPSPDCLVLLVDEEALSKAYEAVHGFLVDKLESVEAQVVKDVLEKLKYQTQKLSILEMTAPKMTELSVDDTISLLEYFDVHTEHVALSHIIHQVPKMSKAKFLSIKGMVNDECKKLLETKVTTEAGVLGLLESLHNVSDKHKIEFLRLLIKDGIDAGNVTESDLNKHFDTKESLDACCQLLGVETERLWKNPTILIVDTHVEKSSLEKNTGKVISRPDLNILTIITISSNCIDVYVQYRGMRKRVECSLDSSIAVKEDGKVLVDGVTIY